MKLNELEVRRQYQFKISKRFAGLHKLNDSEEINRDSENLRGNFKNSAKASLRLHKLKQHKPRFDEECLSSLDQRKQVKMQ